MTDKIECLESGAYVIHDGDHHDDARGSFRETWRASSLPFDFRPVQENFSESQPGVLRGLHFHLKQVDLWRVVSGTARIVLLDVRGGSLGSINSLRIEANQECSILIPRGVAHGFLSVGQKPLILRYLVDNYYDGKDEHGIHWSTIAPAWKLGLHRIDAPKLSPRDQQSLCDLSCLPTQIREMLKRLPR